jgi:hypothetical protein
MKKSTARILAREHGEKFYTPEQPCKKGHVERRTSTGGCPACARLAEQLLVAADRGKYNARKKRERTNKLPELAKKMRVTRAAEPPQKKELRLEAAKLKQREWRKNNPGHLGTKASKRAYKQRNPGRVLADTVRRRVAKINRTPTWLTADDNWMIEQVYALAALRTKMFGFSWHVDHIIPLQGKLVSGLHVPTNLQVIPGVENVRKANRYLPA